MKQSYQQLVLIAGCSLIFSGAGKSQETMADRVAVPLRDPARPALVKGSLMAGGITVKGYDGKEVIVEARLRPGDSDDEEKAKAGGLKRINIATTGLTVEEDDNVVNISTGLGHRAVDLVIQVPFKTSLKLSCMNEGDIRAEKVEGEIEANNLNGAVTLTNVSGVVIAHSLNGPVRVNLERVTADKPMSFSTMNGDIDVTLPGDTKAKVKMETQNGSIYTDFEIQMSSDSRQPAVEDGHKEGGKYPS